MERKDQVFDVCIVCALAEEARAFLRLVEDRCHASWSHHITERSGYDCRLTTIPNARGEPLRLQVSWLSRYGSQEMVLHLTHVLEEAQPRLVLMTGICAGDRRHVHLGDLIVAERTFTADSGKFTVGEQGQVVHQHDTITYLLQEQILRFVPLFERWKDLVGQLARPRSKRHQRDWLLQRLLAEATASVTALPLSELEEQAPDWRRIVHELQQGEKPVLLPSLVLRNRALIERLSYGLDPFPFLDPPQAQCHIRPLASTTAVRSDNPFHDIQIPVRGAIAVDMEGAAFGRVMQQLPDVGWLIVKGVSDYADQDKDDSYHAYAATASAMYALCFLEDYVTHERFPSRERNVLVQRAVPTGVWNVPYLRNPHFTGREEVLDRLHQQLFPTAQQELTVTRRAALTQPQAIKGLGGIGKTQIAVEYAYRSLEQEHYTHTLWVNAASEEALLTSFVALAELLPDDFAAKNETDQDKLVAAIKRWLEQCQERWLLIFDNADEVSLVQRYLPTRGPGSILLTTRADAIGSLATPIEVETMGFVEGAELLLRRAQRFEKANDEDFNEAGNIVVALDYFPLALDQAGAYIDETKCRFADYLSAYQDHRKDLLARRGTQVTNYPDSVATTWSLSFKRVEQKSPAAAELLHLCAFLSPDRIPEELIKNGASHWTASLQQAASDSFTFNEMIEELLKFSLVKRLVEDQMLSIHRLVQAVQIDMMEPGMQRQWAERVVLAVNGMFPDAYDDVATWPQCLRFLEQAQACDTLIQQHILDLNEAADLLNRTGGYMYLHALYAIVEPLFQRALAIREKVLYPGHPDLATSLSDLAILYWTQSKYEQAEPLFQRAISISEKVLGSDHLDLAKRLNGLGILYVDQGKYEQAEPLFQRALAISEKALGPDHLDLAKRFNNFALLCLERGRYEQAELLFRRAVTIGEKVLDPDHPDLSIWLHNLALAYLRQGKYEQAEPLSQRAITIGEKMFGSDHPDLAFMLLNLATVYLCQGKYEQAEPLYQRSLQIREQRLGLEHPQVAYSLNGMAKLYVEQGKYEQAELLFRRAITIGEKTLGPDHPNLADWLNNLADLYYKQNKYEQARPLYQQGLAILEQKLGLEHPDTLTVRENYASLLQAMERK